MGRRQPTSKETLVSHRLPSYHCAGDQRVTGRPQAWQVAWLSGNLPNCTLQAAHKRVEPRGHGQAFNCSALLSG
jgi:hypothetical protein